MHISTTKLNNIPTYLLGTRHNPYTLDHVQHSMKIKKPQCCGMCGEARHRRETYGGEHIFQEESTPFDSSKILTSLNKTINRHPKGPLQQLPEKILPSLKELYDLPVLVHCGFE